MATTNPFPGVDPYVEAAGLWVGFHNTLIGDCGKLLNASLPGNYAALVDVRVELVDVSELRSQGRRPDIGIVHDITTEQPIGVATATMAEISTATLTPPDYESVPEAFIDILSLPDRELVTSIEILSPTNKMRGAKGEYPKKRAEMINLGINLVEIDLLLDGERLSLKEPLPTGDFYAFVSRGNMRPKCEVFSWSIRRKLPKISIPLRVEDADVLLDLQSAFAATYEGGRYHQTLRYELPLPSSLSKADREWAGAIVKQPIS